MVLVHLSAESIAGPGLRAARHGIDVARKQQRPSAVRAFMARADIGPVLVVAAFPEQRMIHQSRHVAQMIEAWLPTEFAQKMGHVVLASEFGSHWRRVFRRNADQVAN